MVILKMLMMIKNSLKPPGYYSIQGLSALDAHFILIDNPQNKDDDGNLRVRKNVYFTVKLNVRVDSPFTVSYLCFFHLEKFSYLGIFLPIYRLQNWVKFFTNA